MTRHYFDTESVLKARDDALADVASGKRMPELVLVGYLSKGKCLPLVPERHSPEQDFLVMNGSLCCLHPVLAIYADQTCPLGPLIR